MNKILREMTSDMFSWVQIFRGYLSDFIRFGKFSCSFRPRENEVKQEAQLTMLYHVVEKALSLPSPRLGFGVERINRLINETDEFYNRFGYKNIVKISLENLTLYKKYHEDNNYYENQATLESIDKITEKISEYDSSVEPVGGRKQVFSKDIIDIINDFDFSKFAACRHSVRNFAHGEVPYDAIKEAVDMSSKTPCVCNRQSWHVRIYRGREKVEALKLQKGNSGFSESIDTALLITGRMSYFKSVERNQVYIDGGLFSMSLIYALHSLGLGVCPLNTAFGKGSGDYFRKKLDLYIDEVPIMMLAVGQLKDDYWVASSPKKSSDTIILK